MFSTGISTMDSDHRTRTSRYRPTVSPAFVGDSAAANFVWRWNVHGAVPMGLHLWESVGQITYNFARAADIRPMSILLVPGHELSKINCRPVFRP